MNFLESLKNLDLGYYTTLMESSTEATVRSVLGKRKLSFSDYVVLLSQAAGNLVEDLAIRSRELTLKHFGKTILFYAPLYLSNECINQCVYCGFREAVADRRVTLSVEEVMQEAAVLYAKGLRHILLVCGEAPQVVGMEYLRKVVQQLHKRFDSVGIEIYPLTRPQYAELCAAGADSITIYQEVYNRDRYKEYHPGGPKADYVYRLETPQRAAKAGFYRVNIGTLLGLGPWQEEAVVLGAHAAFLAKHYWRSHVAVSFPRLQASAAGFVAPCPVLDRQLVQMICALRIYQPTMGLVLSTREPSHLRDNLIGLGITQVSAQSCTSPGGYSCKDDANEQFQVADQRSVEEVAASVIRRGYEPVFKDWDKGINCKMQ